MIEYPSFKNKEFVFLSILSNGDGWPYHKDKHYSESDISYLNQFFKNNNQIGTERLVFDSKEVLFSDYQKWLLSFIFKFN